MGAFLTVVLQSLKAPLWLYPLGLFHFSFALRFTGYHLPLPTLGFCFGARTSPGTGNEAGLSPPPSGLAHAASCPVHGLLPGHALPSPPQPSCYAKSQV